MKLPFTLFLIIIFSQLGYPQLNDCNCLNDLEFVLEKLKKTPSYKEQIKGEKKRSFNTFVERTKQEMLNDSLLNKHCRAYLGQVINQVNDKHLFITSTQKSLSKMTEEEKKKVLTSDAFKNTPKVSLDLDSLKKTLEEEPIEKIEGIYSRSKYDLMLAVVPVKENEYNGIVLNSNQDIWEPGHVMFQLTENKSGKTTALAYNANHEAFYMEEKSAKHFLQRLSLFKKNEPVNYWKKGGVGINEFKKNGDNTYYFFISSFNGRTNNLRVLDSLYLEVIPKLEDAKKLIVDIRNNGGGGERAYAAFLKWLKKNPNPPELFLIVNRFTASAAEHFSLELKALGATILGEATSGAINYRYPNRFKGGTPITPCHNYKLIFTVASNKKKYKDLEKEFNGILPDILLENDRDWVEQTKEKL